MSAQGHPERVYVELGWYDGPRSGIADFDGSPHRFESNFDGDEDDWAGTFYVFPIDPEVLAREQEQWCLFVNWNRCYESGVAGLASHPAHGGVDLRWDELQVLLAENRNAIPTDAKQAKAEFFRLDRDERYTKDGPDYALRWTLL